MKRMRREVSWLGEAELPAIKPACYKTTAVNLRNLRLKQALVYVCHTQPSINHPAKFYDSLIFFIDPPPPPCGSKRQDVERGGTL